METLWRRSLAGCVVCIAVVCKPARYCCQMENALSDDVLANGILQFLEYQVAYRVFRSLNSDFKRVVDTLYYPTQITLCAAFPTDSNYFSKHIYFQRIHTGLQLCLKNNPRVFKRVEYLNVSQLFTDNIPNYYHPRSFNKFVALEKERLSIIHFFPNTRTLVLNSYYPWNELPGTSGHSQLKSIAKVARGFKQCTMLYDRFNLKQCRYTSALELYKQTPNAERIVDSYTQSLLPNLTIVSTLRDYNIHASQEVHLDHLSLLHRAKVSLEHKQDHLNTCAANTHFDCVKCIVESSKHEPEFQESINYALRSATQGSDQKIVQSLLDYGANPHWLNKRDPHGHSALELACILNKPCVKMLLQSSYPCERSPFTHTCTRFSASYSNPAQFQELIDAGFSATDCDEYGNNLLHLLVANMDMHNVLAIPGVTLDMINARNKLGATPLHICLKTYGMNTITQTLIDNGGDLSLVDNYGNTSLHYYAATGKVEYKAGVDGFPDETPNVYGMYPTHLYHAFPSSRMISIRDGITLDQEVNLKALHEQKDDDIKMLMHRTLLSYGSVKRILLYLEQDNPVLTGYALFIVGQQIACNKSVELPLHDSNNRTMAHFLGVYGGDLPRTLDRYGRPPVFYTIQTWTSISQEVERFFSNAKEMNLYLPDVYGETAVSTMLRNKDLPTWSKRFVVNKSFTPDVKAVSANGDSVLHLVIRHFFTPNDILNADSVVTIKSLRNKGIDVLHRNNDGLTALELFDQLYGDSLFCSQEVKRDLKKSKRRQ